MSWFIKDKSARVCFLNTKSNSISLLLCSIQIICISTGTNLHSEDVIFHPPWLLSILHRWNFPPAKRTITGASYVHQHIDLTKLCVYLHSLPCIKIGTIDLEWIWFVISYLVELDVDRGEYLQIVNGYCGCASITWVIPKYIRLQIGVLTTSRGEPGLRSMMKLDIHEAGQ